MFNRTKWMVPGAMITALSLTGAAQAASVNELILQEGPGIVLLEDDDATYAIDRNQNGFLDVGDSLRGMIRIQRIEETNIGQNTGQPELTAVYQVRVTEKIRSGDQFAFTFGADEDFGEFSADREDYADVYSNPLVAIYEDQSPDVTLTNAATPEDAIATATNGSLWAVLTLDGDGTFWRTTADTDDLSLAASAPAEGQPATGALGSPFAEGAFALNRIVGAGLSDSLIFLPLPESGTDFSGTFALYGQQPLFGISSDADIRINVIPLPAAVWGGMTLLAGVVAYRRRRMA